MSSDPPPPRDLVALVADRDIRAVISGILWRREDLGIRPIQVNLSDVLVHPHHDPACRLRAAEYLRGFASRYAHALVVFDRAGCGRESDSAEELEKTVESDLAKNGWPDRCAAVVLDPEIEAWVWSDSPHVARCLGWSGREPRLRAWLESKGLWNSREAKPRDPKHAFRQALREARRPAAATVFSELAASVSAARCSDRAFMKFKDVLQRWFPPISI